MNQKFIIAAAAISTGLLLFGALVVVPLLRGIKTDSKDLENQYLKVLEASSAETEAAEFLKFVQAKAGGFEQIEGIFADAETPIGFIEFLEEIAASSNLDLKITPGKAQKQKGVPWPAMDFQLAGSLSYPDFFRFLEKLENGPFLLEARNTSLVRERASFGDEESAKDISFTVLVQVFTGSLPETENP